VSEQGSGSDHERTANDSAWLLLGITKIKSLASGPPHSILIDKSAHPNRASGPSAWRCSPGHIDLDELDRWMRGE
jgi:hypothetical protein